MLPWETALPLIVADGSQFHSCDVSASKVCHRRTSLVVQWLRLCLPSAGRPGLIPSPGAKIPHALKPKNQNKNQKQYCNKFKKTFLKWPTSKKKKTL